MIKSPIDAKRGPGKVWKPKETPDGLFNAAQQLHESVRDELAGLRMSQSKLDSSLFLQS